jgi:hypothetical protein
MCEVANNPPLGEQHATLLPSGRLAQIVPLAAARALASRLVLILEDESLLLFARGTERNAFSKHEGFPWV